MGEKAKKIGDKLEGFGERLFERFGWSELTRDEEIKCKKSKHKNDEGNSKVTHGVDIYHKYYDPYKKQNLGVITECKNYQWQSINKTNLQKWFNQLLDTIECAQFSEELQEYNAMCNSINTGILLVHASDKYDERKFREYLGELRYPSKKSPINIYVVSNSEIEKWDTMFTYIENNCNRKDNNFKFYNPCISGSGLQKYNHILLSQLFSSYIFAENTTEKIGEYGGRECRYTINQMLIFSFDKISTDSFKYICDMFKELQLENFDEYIFCFYPETKGEIDIIDKKFIEIAIEAFGEENRSKIKEVTLDNRRLSPVDTK